MKSWDIQHSGSFINWFRLKAQNLIVQNFLRYSIMRYAPRRGFLHPVLGQRDVYYEGKKFNVELKCHPSDKYKEILFSADFSIEVEAINRLIDRNEAICIIWIYCGRTSFREIYKGSSSNLRKIEGSIELQKLRGNIEFHPSVIATKDILLPLDEANKAFRSDGRNIRLISTGSPLAVHKPSYTKLEFDIDRGTKSIFQLEVDYNMQDGSWEINADPRKAFVVLSANENTRYNFEKFRSKGLAIHTLYLAAMVQALNILLYDIDIDIDEEDFSKWSNIIGRKLSELKIYIEFSENEAIKFFADGNKKYLTPLWVAQKLLENPLSELIFEDSNNEESGD